MFKQSKKNPFNNPKVFTLPFEPPAKKKLNLWKPLLILLLVVGIFYILFLSPIFKIKNIVVDEGLPPEIAAQLQKYQGNNIFLLRSQAIKNDLIIAYPELQDLKVIRGIPDLVKIECTKRTPKIVWQSGLNLYLVDGNGIAYKKVDQQGSLILVKDNTSLPVKTDQPLASGKFISFVTELDSKLTEKNFKVDHYEINETTFQVDAVTVSHFILKFDVIRPADEQITDLETFWKDHSNEPKAYIDLRVGGKVFYK